MNDLIRFLMAFLCLGATALHAQDVGAWGWRGSTWVELLRERCGIDAEVLQGEGASLPVEDFERYKVVIISQGKPAPLTAEQHEKVRQYLENGGFLLVNTISIAGMAAGESSGDLSPAESWLGATRYDYGAIDAQVFEADNPALAGLGEPAWFRSQPGLSGLTTGRSLLGLPDRARVLVNRVGKGGLLFISAEVGEIYAKMKEEGASPDAEALLAMVQVFLKSMLTDDPPVDAVFGPVISAARRQQQLRDAMPQVRLGERKEPFVVLTTGSEKEAAGALTGLLGRSLEKKVELAREAGDFFAIHVGRTPYVESLGLDFDGLHPYGYFMKLVDGRHLVLAGKLPAGTTYAVYDFLKRYMGYRYFAPGKLGVILPQHAAIPMPETLDLREEPSVQSFTNAGLYGGNGAFSRSWRTTLFATHVLGSIISPAKYGKSHPEYFPMYNGKRFIPGEKLEGTWQPCVSHPDLPRLAIEWGKDYFAKNPQAQALPLGVNDGGGDCRCPDCLKAKEKYGNQYLPFYNETARLAKKAFPGKYVAFIAYGGARKAPRGIELEDNLLVEIASGLANGMRPFQEWREAGARHLGLYDYLYGGGQVVPRHYPRVMAKAWRDASQEYGMKSLWIESFTRSWYYDGPRQYVLNEVAWNLDAPVDALLKDYFENFYGPAAGPMQAAFERMEQVYLRRPDPLHPMSDWKRPEQLADFTDEDLAAMRRLLAEAREQAGSGDCGERVALFSQLWDLSERLITSCLSVQKLDRLKGGEQGWDRIVVNGYEALRKIEAFSLPTEVEKALFSHEGLESYKGMERLKMRPELEIAADRFFLRTDRALGAEAGAFYQAELARVPSEEARFLLESHLQEQKQGEKRENLFALKADDVETGAASADWKSISDRMPGWSTWTFPNSVTLFEISNEGVPDGGKAMVIRQNDIGGCFLRNRSVRAGERFRLRLRVKQSKGSNPGSVSIRWKDRDGRWLPESGEGSRSPVTMTFPTPDEEWHEASVLFTIPEGARNMTLLLSAPTQGADEAIRFYDVALYKVHDLRESRRKAAGL
ncbi:MAG TPA: DUF4838 domain-containing protein [Chthoniobacteraceae bacterium]|nr:DUF4838 domain-containing protein [Chthoniobacteraceae bacterium]